MSGWTVSGLLAVMHLLGLMWRAEWQRALAVAVHSALYTWQRAIAVTARSALYTCIWSGRGASMVSAANRRAEPHCPTLPLPLPHPCSYILTATHCYSSE